ncbi:RHS repeat-associated core domain-containing protein [Nocardiopsis sp. CC223A]|uniref:RHS repeat-associated core domain-containing protein n=1 Tax=Nocardiopsis sp. CC223A TaxID=3044051 RepID=UPI0027954E65|nr:RHS repeat-associated core domain-containing protein [Nocardiopsis sp. CC223A]
MSSRQWSWRKFKWAFLTVTSTVLVFALIASLLGIIPGLPSWWRDKAPELQDLGDPVEGVAQEVLPTEPGQEQDAAVTEPGQVDWPTADSGVVPVTAHGQDTDPVEVGGLTLWATSPSEETGQIQVDLLDEQAAQDNSVHGLMLKVTAADGQADPGQVELTVDYSGIENAYGGNYGARLRLVDLGADAAQTQSTNDISARTVTATIAPGAVTAADDRKAPETGAPKEPAGPSAVFLALDADPFSWEGDYTATELSPSSEWDVSLSSGAFTWSYGLTVPPTPGKLEPVISLGYSSQTTDGRTAATNNQGSWVGEGFSYEPGYIERSYASCSDDGEDDKADLCWATDNATLMLNGQSTELVRDDDTGEWKPRIDDGSRIERLTEATNGDNNGEYWRVTTVDGIQYTFGLNRLPGWESGDPVTNSVWTAPVFGNDSGEPCHKADFSEAWCQQGWRWNLDYVEDPRGNIASFHYTKEINHYALDGDLDTAGTQYVRGGYLDRIDYGLRQGETYDTQAPAQVVFTTAERCLKTDDFACDPADLDADTAKHWPDIPYDLHCAEGDECDRTQTSPSFWTQKRLSSVHTQILTDDGYSKVDSWKLDHLFTDNGDGSKTLWLSELTRTGHVGGTQALPPIQFTGIQLPNRIRETGDQISALVRFRMSNIYTETGGQITVNYSGSQCTPDKLPKEGESTDRCYPIVWSPPGFEDPVTDWFHKYVVNELILTDRTGGSEEQVTRYDYQGDAAWRYAEPDGITPEDHLTWSQWRGYETVRVSRGNGEDMPVVTEHTFLRGMHGDKHPAGGTRTVSVTDSTGEKHTDHDELSGFSLETTTFNGEQVVDTTISRPWRHRTGTQSEDWGTRHANFVAPRTQLTRTALEDGDWRQTQITTFYDSTYGRPTQVDDQGDIAVQGDELCTRTQYVDNTDKHMVSYISREETVAVNCSATPDRAQDVVSDDRWLYDGHSFGEGITRGDKTAVQRLAEHDGTNATYQTVETHTYDDYGNVISTKDTNGVVTSSLVARRENGLTVERELTDALGYTARAAFDPHRGSHLWETDANGRRIEATHDPLGRIAQVWDADRDRSRNESPNQKFEYIITEGAPVAVKTETLRNDGSYQSSYAIYDGFLRERQIQLVGPDEGRLVTDVFHGSTGQVVKKNDPYYALGAPSAEVLAVRNGDVGGQVVYEYDGADRVIHEIRRVSGDEKWRSTISYGGDRVHKTPPAGGTPTTEITDARGNTVELRQYYGDSPEGEYQAISYAYTPSGEIERVTSPEGSQWSYRYDQRGRIVEMTDPDAGRTTKVFDDLDQEVSATDARGVTLSTSYDIAGRKVSTWEGEIGTGTQLASWTYDVKEKGLPYMETRFHEGNQYRTAITERDDMYRPTKTVIGIPDGHGSLSGNYTFTTSYNIDGTVQSLGIPAAGDLPAEVITYEYDELSRPLTMSSGLASYVTRTDYAQTGEVLQYELSSGQGPATWLTYEYEKGTQRLTRSRVDRQGIQPLMDSSYQYDAAGNILSIADTPSGAGTETRCFEYDKLRRLAQSWTLPSSDGSQCKVDPTPEYVGGIEPYWHSYEYDADGNRTREIRHAFVAAGTFQDSVREYVYPGSDQPRPHAVQEIVESTQEGDRLYAYEYDESGNTTNRTEAGVSQELLWDAQGNLDSVLTQDGITSYVYVAGNERIIRQDPAGATLYLPGMDVREENGNVTTSRYYTHNGSTIAVRAADGVDFLASDHHGTAKMALSSEEVEDYSRRRFLPFGQQHGENSEWPNDRGFLGKTVDDRLGVVYIGAREYDPGTGRFISVDPLIDISDSQQMNGYAYANNNPVTLSDSTGLMLDPEPCPRGGCGKHIPIRTTGGTHVAVQPQHAFGFSHGYDFIRNRVDWGGAQENANVATYIAWAVDYRRDFGDDFADGYIIGINTALMEAGFDFRDKEFQEQLTISANYRDYGHLQDPTPNGIGPVATGRRPRGCQNSFVEGTLVLLSDGSTKPIEDIEVGENVFAADPETGEEGARTVVATIIGEGFKTLVEITVDTSTQVNADTLDEGALPDGPSRPGPLILGDTIVSTDGHPFWVPLLGEWVDAVDLVPGMWFLSSEETLVQVVDTQTWSEVEKVYNLTVQGLHTYYVIAGETALLTHNASCANRNLFHAGLPQYAPGGTTHGIGTAPNGLVVSATSGNVRNKKDSMGWVNDILRDRGILAGRARSTRAHDAEQTFAYRIRDMGKGDAHFVINNPNGPCGQGLGCNQVLPYLIGEGSTLTVHWMDHGGNWQSREYRGSRR